MTESGYYPPGAEFDPSAPYNQPSVPDETFGVLCSQTLSRTTKVTTNNYKLEYDKENELPYANTEDTEWESVYRATHFTPLELIRKFRALLLDIKTYGFNNPQVLKSNPCVQHLDSYIEECSGWQEDEVVFIEE